MRMRKFNEDDYEMVKGLENKFRAAIKSRYVTGVQRTDLETVKKIYMETLGRQANLSCSGCVLQMMSSVGRLYFKYKDEQEKIDDKEGEGPVDGPADDKQH